MDKRLDLLTREEFVENVIKIVNQLSDIKRGCCFAIEGGWGIGKTFVIEEIEEQLKAIQSEETNGDRYFVFHYNCWQHDYYDEPAVAIISAMLASIREDEVLVNGEVERIIKAGYESVGEELKKIAGLYIENRIGINLISWAEDIKNNKEINQKAENEFDEMFNFSQTIEQVRKKLQEIATERTILLFVDELDRCIPQYAIKVLERLHHIFYGLCNVVVIMAIDRKQLEHSVEEMFGARQDESSIDIERYLKKFIDFSMVLDRGVAKVGSWQKFRTYFEKFYVITVSDGDDVNNILLKLLGEIDIRCWEKTIEKANLIHMIVCNRRIDISVLVFEIMYEMLKIWKFSDLRCLVEINDRHWIDMEKQIGAKRMEILKSFANDACEVVKGGYKDNNIVKYIIHSDLYGKVFWYFINIFYEEKVPPYYVFEMSYKKEEVVIVKKYCELCQIIK